MLSSRSTRLLQRDQSIEIRDYPSMIVAESRSSGQRKAAIRKGFRLIAGYIFGNNLSSQRISMTAPVIEQSAKRSRCPHL